ncbi:MAG: transcription antitermination factor NusB [Fusobacteriaceae bacterium]|jgi:N utilization substance protein B|nr:transcription antitermination factor NusB [Fusobacteriaceae bacterium]
MRRSKLRETVFHLLFENELLEGDELLTLEAFRKRMEAQAGEKAPPFGEKDMVFLESYLGGIKARKKEIRETIDQNMTGWVFDRIGFVERALFLCSVYELLQKEIPYEIVVDEAVELAKRYGDEKTPDFINGVLARIINK